MMHLLTWATLVTGASAEYKLTNESHPAVTLELREDSSVTIEDEDMGVLLRGRTVVDDHGRILVKPIDGSTCPTLSLRFPPGNSSVADLDPVEESKADGCALDEITGRFSRP